MNAADCAALVNQLISTWPTGVRGHIWTKELADLDHARADAAYRRLVASCDRPPSVARFLEEYRAGDRPTLCGWEPPVDNGPPISLDEHIARLEWRDGTQHDESVTDELAHWRRLRAVAPDGCRL